MAKEDSQPGLADMIQRMQAPFMTNGAVGAPMERFLAMQGTLLKEAEIFTRHWFERRHDAIETAMEALNQMNSSGVAAPADAARVIADWQRGCLERLSADAQEWSECCMRGAAAATTAQVDAATKAADQPEAEKTQGKAGAKPGAGHATPV